MKNHRRQGFSTPLVIAIMAFAVVAFLFLIDTAINRDGSKKSTNTNTASVITNTNIAVSPKSDISTDGWKTYVDSTTGFTIRYPQDWDTKTCGDTTLAYFAPGEIGCGAGLDAIGIQRAKTDQTIEAAVTEKKSQLTQTTILRLKVDGLDAERIIGIEPKTAMGDFESRQNDQIFFRQGEFLWELSSTLQDDGRVFLAMADTLKISTTSAEPEILPDNVVRFTSTNLGITFTYLETAKDYKATVQEIGDKVYIGVNLQPDESITTGQWVQKIDKKPSDSLSQAITKKFLSGYSSTDCFVKKSTYAKPAGWEFAVIGFPTTNNANDPWFVNAAKCPTAYTASNWIGYFAEDPKYPTRYFFFSIGQYAIQGLNAETPWQDTVQSLPN